MLVIRRIIILCVISFLFSALCIGLGLGLFSNQSRQIISQPVPLQVLPVREKLSGLIPLIPKAHAQTEDEDQFQTKAKFAIIIDADKPFTFLEKQANVAMAPASMSKLMTIAIVFRELKAGRLKLEDKVRISVHAWRTGGAPSRTAAMFAPVKSEITVEQALRGIVVQSGNDAAIAIAEHIGGSEAEFAALMTDYGKKIGLKHSSFANPTGLPHPKHLMSAHDLALLAKHIVNEFPEYYFYFSEKEFKYRRYRFINRNPLIGKEGGFDGLKTGFTEQSKYGIVVSAKRNGRRLIAVLNGLESKVERRTESIRVMNWAFNAFSNREISDASAKFSARIWGGEKSSVALSTAGQLKIFMPKGDDVTEIFSEVIYNGPLKAPVVAGQKVAKLRVKVAQSVQEFDLYANETVKRTNFVYRAFDSLFYLTFGWIF